MEKYCNNTALVIDCPADSQASTIGAIQVFFKYFFHLTPPGALSTGTDFGVNMLEAFTLSAAASGLCH